MDYKIFKFDHNEGAEILAANNAKEAIMYYFTHYQDYSSIDDALEYGGIKIEELKGEQITKKIKVFNEETGVHEEISYMEIADEVYKDQPEVFSTVLVTPNY